MSNSNGTAQELLLQLNDKINEMSEHIGNISSNIEAIKDSVSVLNHNSTSLDARVGSLETKQITNEELKKHIDAIKSSTRNWLLVSCAVVGIVVSVITYIRPI